MNGDAQEAVLGLLSMGHNYFSQPTPSAATSSATLNSILTTTASPLATLSTIPQKRKQSEVDAEASIPSAKFGTPTVGNDDGEGLERGRSQPPPYHHTPSSPPAEALALTPQRNGAKGLAASEGNDTSSEAVDCICGFAIDDGFSIACDICGRWCHAACFSIAPGGVPEKFMCWACKPRTQVERERAVKLQMDRMMLDLTRSGEVGGDGKEGAKHRRRASPGVERKPRRAIQGSVAAATIGAAVGLEPLGKKKRRPSIVQHTPTTPHLGLGTMLLATSSPNPEEEHIDIDNEPWKEAYVHISDDIIPNDETRAKLRRQAQHWRGVTAVDSPATPAVVPPSYLTTPPPVAIRELPAAATLNPFLALNSNPEVLPPAFSLHTTQPIPSQALITPFRACITPSASYLADPLNAYAHLGMPKPYVHLMGPPFELALDARLVGNHGRFVRRGCKPNAVLRPVLCDEQHEHPTSQATTKGEDGSLGFGVFALRDLKANEEIVLGWEWDDGNAVHSLPALLEAPFVFPQSPSYSSPHPKHHSKLNHLANSPRTHHVEHLRNQMSNILHALSSTFTTCACGARARDCALTQMAAFVDGQEVNVNHQFHRDGCEDEEIGSPRIDMGPLVGRKRGFKTRERIPNSGGMGGMELMREESSSSADEGAAGVGKGRGLVWDGMSRAKDGSMAASVVNGHGRGLEHPPLPRFVLSPSSPSPSKRSTKGKERAIDADVEMADIGNRSSLLNIAPTTIGNSTSSSSSHSSAFLSSTPHDGFEPRPPDPLGHGFQHQQQLVLSEASEDRMPPKMRKKWMHRELEARKEQSSKTEAAADSAAASTKIGLGIRFDSEGIEQDEHLLMPPPPMPASLDPTTILSTEAAKSSSASPNPSQHIQLLPQLQHHTAQSASPSLSPAPQFSPFATASPLTSFANLSILSPALLTQSHGSMKSPRVNGLATSHAYPFPPDAPSNAPEVADDEVSNTAHVGQEDEMAQPKFWSPLRRGENSSTSSGLRSVMTMDEDNQSESPLERPERPTPTLVDDISPTAKLLDVEQSVNVDEDGDVVMSPIEKDSAEWRCQSSERGDSGHTPPLRDPDSLSSTPPARSASPPANILHRSVTPQPDIHEMLDYTAESPTPSTPPASPPPPPATAASPPPMRSSGGTSTISDTALSPAPMLDVLGPSLQRGDEDKESDGSSIPGISPAAAVTKLGEDLGQDTSAPMSSSNIVDNDATSSRKEDTQPAEDQAESASHSQQPSEAGSQPESQAARQASPPPAPKVHMSFQDFVMRKKKQKELTKSIQASPMSGNSALGDADGHDGDGNKKQATSVGVEEKKVYEMVDIDGKPEDRGCDELKDESKGNAEVKLELDNSPSTSTLLPEKNAPKLVQVSLPPKHEGDVEMAAAPQHLASYSIDPDPPAWAISEQLRSRLSQPPPARQPQIRLNVSWTPAMRAPPPLLLPARPAFPSSDTHLSGQLPANGPYPMSSRIVRNKQGPTPSLLQRVSGFERSMPLTSQDQGFPSFASRISQEEDGEIGEQPPLNRNQAPFKRDLPRVANSFQNHIRATPAHSPPTGPRAISRAPVSNNVFPGGRLSPSAPMARPPPPAAAAARPPPPSAPRALRQSLLSNKTAAAGPPPLYSNSNGHGGGGGGSHPPRGPSADRDRDRDRSDWDWDPHRPYHGPSRGSGNGPGWGK